ncbi:WAT1-related protein [Rhynchospora pubera]|uniref:WAT1-related protein n=1 Tax=Rhynchospora pubera TaxID=906938 RepID=A0AAV8D0K5_9POAL|nr:WAT1-related protein [Rhynchospora pubera]
MSNTTKAYVIVFLIRFIYAIMQILTKATFDNGMSTSVFVFYRHLVASLFLIPIAFVLERKRAPPLSYKITFKLFVHALYGISVSINIYSIGLNYASATSGAAIYNLLPVIAFLLALLLRMETMNLKRWHGVAKASGILLCVVGVAILAFYEGPTFKSINHHQFRINHGATSHGSSHSKWKWILGIFLMTLSVITWSLWTVLQGPMLEEYPSKVLNTTLQCFFATIQSFFMALALERDFFRWKLGFNLDLLTVVYSGIAVSGISYYLQVWAIEKKGPVFLAMSMPLTLVFTIVLSSLLLGEIISLGSVIGGALMVGALYAVLWGKNTEKIYSDQKTSQENQAYIQNKEQTNPAEEQETLP